MLPPPPPSLSNFQEMHDLDQFKFNDTNDYKKSIAKDATNIINQELSNNNTSIKFYTLETSKFVDDLKVHINSIYAICNNYNNALCVNPSDKSRIKYKILIDIFEFIFTYNKDGNQNTKMIKLYNDMITRLKNYISKKSESLTHLINKSVIEAYFNFILDKEPV